MAKLPVGSIAWHDLTVPNADVVRDFYQAVVGWTPQGLDMGGYEDYAMDAPNSETMAGICYARGVNVDIPPQWMIYIVVANLDESVATVEELGGKALTPKKDAGAYRTCVIQDPAGAVCTLYEDRSEE
jgi:uncharacterized protein